MYDSTSWLWPGWLPRGHLSAITGPAGSEKSRIAAWLAITALRGGPFPDGAPTHIEPERGIMWLDTKGGYERLQERLKGQDFPRSRLFWPLESDKPEGGFPNVDLSDGRWRELVAAVAAQERPEWVILHGLSQEHCEIVLWARVLEFLAALARDIGCAVTLVADEGGRLPGLSNGRSALSTKRRLHTIVSISPWAPDSMDLRLRVTKTEGERPQPLRVRIENGIPSVVPRTARPSKSAVDRAAEYLARHLGSGPKAAFQMIAAAKWENGISRRSLERAKRRLGVSCYRKQDRWWWIMR